MSKPCKIEPIFAPRFKEVNGFTHQLQEARLCKKYALKTQNPKSSLEKNFGN